MQSFVEYLRGENLITESEMQYVAAREGEACVRSALFFLNFFFLSVEQINQITHFDAPGKSFEEKAVLLDLVDPEDLHLYDESDELSSIRQGQLMLDAGIMTLEELSEALFLYNTLRLVEDNTIALDEDSMEDHLFNQYLNIVKRGCAQLFKITVSYDHLKILDSLLCDVYIYQPLIGDGDDSFIVGIGGSRDVMMDTAAELHKRLAQDLNMPPFERTLSEMHDFYSEMLNNINGSCSYKFNIDFDLDLPVYQENIEIKAPQIYTAEFDVLSSKLTVFLVRSSSYQMVKAGA